MSTENKSKVQLWKVLQLLMVFVFQVDVMLALIDAWWGSGFWNEAFKSRWLVTTEWPWELQHIFLIKLYVWVFSWIASVYRTFQESQVGGWKQNRLRFLLRNSILTAGTRIKNEERSLSYALAFLEAILFRHYVLEFPGICLLLEYLHTLRKLYLKMLCTLSKGPAGMPEIVSALFMSLE